MVGLWWAEEVRLWGLLTRLELEEDNLGTPQAEALAAASGLLARPCSSCQLQSCPAWPGAGTVGMAVALQYLARSQGHLGIGGLAELGQLRQNGHQLVRQRGVPPTQLVL